MKRIRYARRPLAALALALGPLSLGMAAPAVAQVSQQPTAVPDGTYQLDPRHASVIARIGHGGGTSLSTFRFGAATGSLQWNGAAPDRSKVDVTVDVKSISHPVPGFSEELQEDRFLNVARFPTARFVSTGIQRTGATTGRITGDFTFMGVTKPLVVDASLVGAGTGNRGAKVIGFTGTAKFKRSDHGFTAMLPGIGDQVELLLDLEFNIPGPPQPAAAPR